MPAVTRLVPVLLLLGSCARPALRPEQQRPRAPREVQSNLLRGDYAGSQACRECHGDIYEEWERSPMHRMTRRAELPETDIRAPFDAGAVFQFKDDRVRLERHGAERFLRIESRRFGDRLFRVTRVIGGRHREDFAGLEVADAAPGARAIGDTERVLPVSFLLQSGTFRYKGYSVLVPERPGLRPGGAWSRTCIFCHNTVPYLSVILGALSGPGTPPYQGEVVDALLPPARRQEFVVTDAGGLRRAVAAEIGFLSRAQRETRVPDLETMPLAQLLREAVRHTRARFGAEDLLETGIGCESCHGGSREHARDFRTKPSFAVKSPFLQVRGPGGREQARAQLVNRTCARCHQVLFSRYPWTWEGGRRSSGPGGSNINSGEARDFLLGACASRLACTGCHDPHAHDGTARRRELETAAGRERANALCTRCHERYAGGAAARAHTHHDPAGPGGLCMACHMPRKNMSLDTRLTRYHRIGAPTDPVRVEEDRPLECALCHAGRDVEGLVADLERLWPRPRRYDRQALRRLYGDLGQNVLLATLARGKPHEQATAIAVLGEQRERRAVPLLYRQLVHPYPILRYYALRALESVLGAPSGIDLHRENAAILAQARKWLLGNGLAVPEEPSSAPVSTDRAEGED